MSKHRKTTFAELSPGDMFLPISMKGSILTCVWCVKIVSNLKKREVGFLCDGTLNRVTVSSQMSLVVFEEPSNVPRD